MDDQSILKLHQMWYTNYLNYKDDTYIFTFFILITIYSIVTVIKFVVNIIYPYNKSSETNKQ